MKKIFVILILLILIACGDKTDVRGFYTEGKNIGIHKETKTEYDKFGFNMYGFNQEGYDKDGYDKDGLDSEKFGKDGWSENKYINKETKTEYDTNGYTYYGFNQEGINKDTGTKYNSEGWDRYNFNEKGINKITRFNFNSEGRTQEPTLYLGELLAEKFLSKPYEWHSYKKEIYFKTPDDKFNGITYMGRSYGYDLDMIALRTELAQSSKELAEKSKKALDYNDAFKEKKEVLEMIEGKFYIDIITNYSPDDKVNSYFTFTFFSPEKQKNAKIVELLVDNKILKINHYLFDSNNIEWDLTFYTKKLPMYFNQVKIPITDELFNLFATMEKNKEIKVRIVTNEDNRFTWINKMEENKGLPIGLGRHYRMKYPSDYQKHLERKFRVL